MENIYKKNYGNISFWRETSDEDIVCWEYAPQLEMDIDIAKELVKNRLEYTQGKSVYALINGTDLKATTKEARDYMRSPVGGLVGISGGAFLSNNIVATLVINLFLKISPPMVPAKFFTKKEDAIKWLKMIKEKTEKEIELEPA